MLANSSSAARSPLSTAPFIYPCQVLLVCSPAKNTRFHGSASMRRADGGNEASKNAYPPRAQGSSSQVVPREAIRRGEARRSSIVPQVVRRLRPPAPFSWHSSHCRQRARSGYHGRCGGLRCRPRPPQYQSQSRTRAGVRAAATDDHRTECKTFVKADTMSVRPKLLGGFFSGVRFEAALKDSHHYNFFCA